MSIPLHQKAGIVSDDHPLQVGRHFWRIVHVPTNNNYKSHINAMKHQLSIVSVMENAIKMQPPCTISKEQQNSTFIETWEYVPRHPLGYYSRKNDKIPHLQTTKGMG